MVWKILGVLLVAGGLMLAARGTIQLRQPPIATEDVYYEHFMARQLRDIGVGGMSVILGVLAYRRGRA